MTDRLGVALHLEAARVPAIQRQPWQVRRAAERHRRIRRGGVVAVAVLAAALTVASLATGPWGDTARPVPADSPTPHVTGTPMFSLAAQPTLTETDWVGLTGGGPDYVHRLSSPPEVLSICVPDPRAQGAPTDAYGTAYREPDRGRQMPLTEYVMQYADEVAAAQAYADVFGTFFGCTDPIYGDATQLFHGSPPSAVGSWRMRCSSPSGTTAPPSKIPAVTTRSSPPATATW